jgi:hypothetical protein
MDSAAPNSASTDGPRRRGWASAFKVAIAAIFLFATGGPSVIAQHEDNATYWRQERQRLQQRQQSATKRTPAARTVEQRPTRLIRGTAPKRGFTRVVPDTEPGDTPVPGTPTASEPSPAGPATAAPAGSPPPAATADVAKPTTQQAISSPAQAQPAGPTLRIVVLGDNIGQQLARGLEQAYAETPQISIARQTRDSSGLVNTRFYDWTDAAKKLLASNDKIDIAVMMLGSNDAQDIQEGGQSHRPRSEGWTRIYKARVEAIATLFRDRKIPLVWVGMPIMRGERLAAEMLAFNEIYREAVQRVGGTYVDVWEGFADDRVRFTLFGPDVNGQVVKLRAGDGVHFTPPGVRKLAYFLESPLKRLIDERRPRVDPVIAVLSPQGQAPQPAVPASVSPAQAAIPAPAGPRPEPGAKPAAEPSIIAALPPQPLAPRPLAAPERPASGPVMRLTQPDIAADGELASRRKPAPAPPQSAFLQKRLVEGAPIEAMPGRADDFSWPRR